MGRKMRVIVTLMVILLVILACSFIPGAKTENKIPPPSATQNDQASEPSAAKTDPSSNEKSSFPLPPNTKIISNQSDTVIGQDKLDITEIVSFYRSEFSKSGLKEDNILTTINKTSFSIVFKGSANGKNIVVQGTDIGDGSVTFSIRYE